MKIIEPKYNHDFFSGVITGENVKYYQKKYIDLKHIYKDEDKNILDDKIMYEVFTIEHDKDASLLWGLTILQPQTVKKEYNMTRGHFHIDRTQPEIYFGLSGEGLLLMMAENGECFAEKIFKNSIHYIDGRYAHRLINTSNDILKVGACWNKLAGHDYESIERKSGFERVFKEEQ